MLILRIAFCLVCLASPARAQTLLTAPQEDMSRVLALGSEHQLNGTQDSFHIRLLAVQVDVGDCPDGRESCNYSSRYHEALYISMADYGEDPDFTTLKFGRVARVVGVDLVGADEIDSNGSRLLGLLVRFQEHHWTGTDFERREATRLLKVNPWVKP